MTSNLSFNFNAIALAAAIAVCGAPLSVDAAAASTSVAQEPLISAKGSSVKPNLLLSIDDSGSMTDTYLPEAADAAKNNSKTRYGHRARLCNGLAYSYDPTRLFNRPIDHLSVPVPEEAAADAFLATNGTDTPTIVYESISYAGKETSDLTLKLANNISQPSQMPNGGIITVYDKNDTTRWAIGKVTGFAKKSPNSTMNVTLIGWSHKDAKVISEPIVARYWPTSVYFSYEGSALSPLAYSYTADGSVDTGSDLYKACNTAIGSDLAAGKGKFIPKIVSAGSSEEEQKNYQNWLHFYFNREQMMKTVLTHAFKSIDERFRVGLATLHTQRAVENLSPSTTAAPFLHIRDFSAVAEAGESKSQRQKFFELVLAYEKISGTPNRGALSFAGRYFGGVAPDQTKDPVQYACQKNFVLLATDGAWNSTTENGIFGPYKMHKKGAALTKVGNEDGGEEAPKKDAANKAENLADVAMHFAKTDLRDKAMWDNCKGAIDGVNVCDSGTKDGVTLDAKQRMQTFTMSLGQFGSLKYTDDYETNALSDFSAIKAGTKNWPGVESTSKDAYKVDDTWHAAVNGDGRFINASDPTAVALGLQNTLAAIQEITGSGSAAATSTLYPVKDNNFMYVASFRTAEWRGDIRRYKIDTATGALSFKSTVEETEDDGSDKSARKELDSTAPSARNILTKGAGSALVPFDATAFGDLDAFKGRCASAPLLSQCPTLGDADKTAASNGQNLVNFIRGQGFSYYRTRESKLGDIVNSAPVFDGKNAGNFKDAGYSDYVKTTLGASGRKSVLYAGANDGMMHAFDASTMKELWAYIPSKVQGELWRLADKNYASNHRFFVDGPSVLADVKLSTGWRRILVFGLGAGGRVYTALDVTDSSNPKLLWEFEHSNLGLTMGRPVIAKLKGGTWVVAFNSGYNNTGPGDGQGHLFILNAETGSVIHDISTGTDAALGPVTAWVDDPTDNTAARFYAGDNGGNLWRFNTDGTQIKLASFAVGGVTQPIATRPTVTELTKAGAKVAVVYVGTGRMVGVPDLSNQDTQSIYAVKDSLGAAGWTNFRDEAVKQELATDAEDKVRKLTKVNPVDWTKKAGWYVDLNIATTKGERINVPMTVQGRTLLAASNIPSKGGSCTSDDGKAWVYSLDVETGEVFNETYLIDNAMVAGLANIYLPNGEGRVIVSNSTNKHTTKKTRPNVYSNLVPRRANWRELRDK